MVGPLDEITRQIIVCSKCALHQSRTKPVPGEGPVPSPLMMVGEAPGAHEDRLGRPFVGPAGKLLDKVLSEVGLDRGSLYITNIVKCRPPGNRVPDFSEVKACIGYLTAQIRIVKPRVVVALGSTAAGYLSIIDRIAHYGKKPVLPPISKIRGKYYVKKLGDQPFYLVPTYHPAGVLRKRSLITEFTHDLRLAKTLLNEPAPTKRGSNQSTLPL